MGISMLTWQINVRRKLIRADETTMVLVLVGLERIEVREPLEALFTLVAPGVCTGRTLVMYDVGQMHETSAARLARVDDWVCAFEHIEISPATPQFRNKFVPCQRRGWIACLILFIARICLCSSS